jgi:phosphatidate cytidylyltransferase
LSDQPLSDQPLARPRSNLALRVISSAVMAPLTIAVAWFGGWVFVLFWAAAACIVLWEWSHLVIGARPARYRTFAAWMIAGLAYAGVLLLAPLVLRRDPALGFTALIFLFAVVWATDIAAYFAGRALGGPRLWVAVSPNKTWSGALGGALGGVVAGLAVCSLAGLDLAPKLASVALALSVASQAGDLLESAIKRHFGAKDASHLIPGHGGLMDRLDGFLTAGLLAAMVGLARGGLDAAAQGLLIWK